jgi:DNA-directed RNA polymerase specialized sigma24 family protein
MAFAMTLSHEEATALSVESVVKARSEIERLVEGKRFFPWLLRFTRSIAVTRARRRAGAVPRGNAPANVASPEGIQELELEQRLLDALAELHVDEQMALGLRIGERLSYADIAALLDYSAGVTLSRLSSARGLLLMRTHEGTGDLS